MKRSLVVLFLLVVCVSICVSQTRKPIFRSIDVSTADKKRSIELGGELRIVFDYGRSREFEKLVDSYAKDLGKPSINQSISSAIVNVKMAAWDDGKTRFEIVEREENNQVRISSAMVDKSSLGKR